MPTAWQMNSTWQTPTAPTEHSWEVHNLLEEFNAAIVNEISHTYLILIIL